MDMFWEKASFHFQDPEEIDSLDKFCALCSRRTSVLEDIKEMAGELVVEYKPAFLQAFLNQRIICFNSEPASIVLSPED